MSKNKKSNFNKNVLTLLTGTTIAQAIPIAITPILTRIYTPEDFGSYALFVAISSIFASISNGRYELAIMLPKKDEESINILALGIILTTLISILLFILIYLFHSNLLLLFKNNEISIWLYFIPLSVFLLGLFNLLNYYNNRKKQYKELAEANIIKSLSLAIGQLVLGFFHQGVGGLIVGQLLSQVSMNIKLIRNTIKNISLIRNIKKVKIIALAKKYKDFPRYSLWAVLANSLSQHMTSILISLFYNISTLGFYSLVQRVLGMPAALIGNSIGQVFYQEAVREKNETGTAMNSFKYILSKLIILGLPIYIILFFIVEDLFTFVLGDNWKIAGTYAQAIIPLFFIRFIVSPLSFMNQVNSKNKLGMLWQFGLLFLHMLIIILCSMLKINFYDYLIIVSILISIYYLILLQLIYQHTKSTFIEGIK